MNVFNNDYENMLLLKTIETIKKYMDQESNSEVVVSFSGGKDSTILLDICRRFIDPNFKGVFLNTGIEHPEILKFVKKINNIDIIRPELSFFKIVEKYGLPVISKEQSKYIEQLRNNSICENNYNNRIKGKFSVSDKWKYLVNSKLKISSKCCYNLKESPLTKYAKKMNYKYLTGERSQESSLRKRYHTCIQKNKCIPLRLWNSEMIEKYISYFNINLSKAYETEVRTGCMFCLFGYQCEEKGNTRIDRMKQKYPKFYRTAQIKLDIDNVLKLIDIGNIPLKKNDKYLIKVDNCEYIATLKDKNYSMDQCEFNIKDKRCNVILKKTDIIKKI